MSTKGGHIGYIRYIGHVDTVDQTQAQLLFAGLELDIAGIKNGLPLEYRFLNIEIQYNNVVGS